MMLRAPLTRRSVLQGSAGVAAALALGPTAFAAEPAPIVATAGGQLRGAKGDGVHAFKGIAYGTAARFKPPAPPSRWSGVKDAVAYGPPCIQDNDDIGVWKDPVPGSEDCLVLNVWSPGLDAAKRPVMVWIHGGGFESGSGGLHNPY